MNIEYACLVYGRGRPTSHNHIGILRNQTKKKDSITSEIPFGKGIEQPSLLLRYISLKIRTQVHLEETTATTVAHSREPNSNAIAGGNDEKDEPKPVERKYTFIVEIHR